MYPQIFHNSEDGIQENLNILECKSVIIRKYMMFRKCHIHLENILQKYCERFHEKVSMSYHEKAKI